MHPEPNDTPRKQPVPPAPSASSAGGPAADRDLREALRAMLTALGMQVLRGDGGDERAEVAGTIGVLLGLDLPATAVYRPAAIDAALPKDAAGVRRVVELLQQREAGPVARLAAAIDPATLTLVPGYSPRVMLRPAPPHHSRFD